MKKLTLVALALMLIFAYAPKVYGGDVTTKGNHSLEVSGKIEIDAVFRDELFDNVFNNPASSDRGSDGFVDVEYNIVLDWTVADKIKAHILLENRQSKSGIGGSIGHFEGHGPTFDGLGAAGAGVFYDDDDADDVFSDGDTFLDVADPGYTGLGVTSGDHGGDDHDFGADQDITLAVREGYITVNEFLHQNVTFKAGLMDVEYSLHGTPFLFDLVGGGFGGFKWTWAQDNWSLEGVVGSNVEERLNGAFTFGNFRDGSRDPQDLWIAHFNYNFDDNKGHLFLQASGVYTDQTTFNASRSLGDVNADPSAFANHAWNNVNSNIYTIGGGADYQFNDWVYLYGEVYWQFGDGGVDTVGSLDVSDNGIGGADQVDEADKSAWAMRAGLRLTGSNEWKPYLDLSFWYLTGDEDADTDATDDDEGFSVFANDNGHNQTFIVEEMDYGLGVLSNYMAVKGMAGVVAPENSQFKNWKFDLVVAWYQVNETGKYSDNNNTDLYGAVDGNVLRSEASDDLGVEVDVKATWMYSEDLTFTFGAGFLFGSDFISDNYTSIGDSSNDYNFASNPIKSGEDTAMMLFININLNF